MTKDDAVRKTKELLHNMVRPRNTEWDMAVVSAMYDKDYDWFVSQLDQVIDICNELKQVLKE